MPASTPITIRRPQPGDFKTLKRLAAMAVGNYQTQVDRMLRHVCDTGETTIQTVDFQRVSTGDRGTLRMLYRIMVADYHGKPVGMSYTGNPISWTKPLIDWPTADITDMAERFTEIQMIAVEPRHRRKGIATHLLTEAEHTIAHTGMRLVHVGVRDTGDYDRLTDWFTRCGYRFGSGPRPDADDTATWRPWRFQPRTGHDSAFDFHRDNLPGQALGFKALHPSVTVTPGTDTDQATVTGLLD